MNDMDHELKVIESRRRHMEEVRTLVRMILDGNEGWETDMTGLCDALAYWIAEQPCGRDVMMVSLVIVAGAMAISMKEYGACLERFRTVINEFENVADEAKREADES